MIKQKPCYILAIESSCDDTAAAVLKNDLVISNIIANQTIHEAYGGVVPELASRAHQQNIVPVVDQALKKAGIDKKDLSAVAYTRGPGLLGSLLVGTSFAKSLSMALNIPLIEVNHLQGHLLSHFIQDEHPTPNFPFLGITVSGGHTQIVKVNSHFNLEELGTTLDDAIGEAFDKCGKVMGLGYPAGPHIDRHAKEGNPSAFKFPIPKAPELNVSYSGFKTAVINFLHKNQQKNPSFIEENLADLCASIQYTLIEIIFEKIKHAVAQTGITEIAIGGGVAANSGLRTKLQDAAIKNNWTVHLPPFAFTTDNAAMIGIVGYFKYNEQQFAALDQSATARLPL
ncbi:MAG: tRNA (adenosine(37)-N6)-threonylcarbamoyltransferase complex transferase subunit TsaD [Candidatus Arcticimaribacter sp.]